MIKNRSRSRNDDFGRVLQVAGGKYFNHAWIELAEGRITARNAAERPVRSARRAKRQKVGLRSVTQHFSINLMGIYPIGYNPFTD